MKNNTTSQPAPLDIPAWTGLTWGQIGSGGIILLSIVWILFDRQLSRARGRFMLSDIDALNNILNRILLATKSDRVVVVEFQGERGTRMVPIAEATRQGILKVTPNIDCRTTCTAAIVESLRKESLKKQEAKTIADKAYYQFLNGLGIDFAAYSLLLNGDRILGFIAIHYTNENSRADWAGVKLEQIAEDIGAITLQLSQGNQRLNRLTKVVSLLKR